jgi:hypothetical protein
MDRYPQYEGGIVVSDPGSFSHPIPLWSVTGITGCLLYIPNSDDLVIGDFLDGKFQSGVAEMS